MSNDGWTADDDRAVFAESLPADHPIRIVEFIYSSLLAGEYEPSELNRFTTPESREWWDDYSEAARVIQAYGNAGFASNAPTAADANDVCYVRVIRSDPGGRTVDNPGGELTMSTVIFTVVWRPELGGWTVHQFGDYVRPDDLVRSDPSGAPRLT